MELSVLNGTNGFEINGEAEYDYSGHSVSAAGDVNGDGYDDLLIGAPFAYDNYGASYVVFGQASGFAANLDLSTLNGTNGFEINGETASTSGRSVSGAGDVNGDGYDDLLIGARYRHVNGNSAGASYVVFGQASGFAANLDLSTLNGTNGFEINGETGGDTSGHSVSAAGDVNGDGFDDVLIGARGRDVNGDYAGASYVVFGQASGFAPNLDLSTLSGTNGFEINGETEDDTSGHSVSGAGDVNGDGYDDLLIGALGRDVNGNSAGASYVVFGQASGFAANLHLSTLNGTNGFEINGETASDTSGYSVSAAGDVNGDGYDDLLIGAPGRDVNGNSAGASYVVFGQASGFAANLHLATLNGTNGFEINGEAGGDTSGHSVSAAGDLNGDGYHDLLIGAPFAYDNYGASYVVFGQASGFAANLHLSALNGTSGFEINGETELDYSGHSVSAAGDVNGDGYDDLLIGARGRDVNGDYAGASYVVFGADFSGEVDSEGTAGDDTLTGDGDANVYVAGLGDDTLNGAGGNDVLKGGSDDDLLIGGAGDDRLFGGLGLDTVSYESEAAAIAVNLATGRASGASTGNDLLDEVEGVIGTGLADTLIGSSGGNLLSGGGGNDTLTGGASGDVFRIAAGDGTDFITDFSGTDAIDVEGIAITAIADGDGSGVLAGQAQVSSSGGITTIHVGADSSPGADLSVTLQGADLSLRLAGGDIAFNNAPTLAQGLADKSALAGIEFEFTIPAGTIVNADPGDEITYTATLEDDSPLPEWLSIDSESGTFSGTPGASDAGTIEVELTATDSGGLSVSDVFTITVDPGVPVLTTGVLDPNFGGDGIVRTDFDQVVQSATSVAVQADGRIVVAGVVANDFALVRYNENGTLDNTFSGDGKVTTSMGDADVVRRIVMQDDGKIIAAGDFISGDFALARYNIDGSLDTMFGGGDGKVTTDIGTNSSDVVYGVALQDDGKIVVAGMNFNGGSVAVVRYASTGTLDNSFDGDGKVTIAGFTAGAVAIQEDGKILVAGGAAFGVTNDYALLRYNSNGSLDLSFDGDGKVITNFGAHEQATALVVQSDGKIVVGGSSSIGSTNDFALVRYNTDGSLDTSFGEGGQVITHYSDADERTTNLVLQADGKIVLVGWSLGEDSGSFILARYRPDGTLDSSFDSDGIWKIQIGEGFAFAHDATVQANGALVVAGSFDGFAALRTLPAGVPDAAAAQNAEFDLAVASYFADPNGDTLTYSATLEGGDPLPEWLSLDSLTGAFSGMPAGSDLGAIEVEVTASDPDGGSVSDVFTLTVITGADEVTGTGASETLDGGIGADTMIGLQGDDTYIVDHPEDIITEEIGAAAGDDEARASVSYVLPANVEDLFLTGAAPINGTGNNLVNLIVGNSAANRLDGGALDDDLRGEGGNDTYVVDNANDQIVEESGEGVADAVESSVTYTLSAHVENLTLMGGAGIGGTGNELANVLAGNTGANNLSGLAGNDSLVGGNGNDTLDGGTGADTMRGGAENDTYIVDNTGDVVIEESGQGTDVVRSSVTRTLGDHQENLVLTGSSAINGTGNSLGNQLIGNNGNNRLEGLAGNDLLKGADILNGNTGADTLIGGLGDDLYYIDSTSDVVTELAGAGQGTADAIYASINLTLPQNVEKVVIIDVNAHFITGNGLNNFFQGNNGNDTLSGAAGNDTLDGGRGNDRIDGGTGLDSMKGGAGDDTYLVDHASDKVVETTNAATGLLLPPGGDGQAGPAGITDTVIAAINYALGNFVENLTLSGSASRATGNSLANRLTGNEGADTLDGAAGNDTLDGGVTGNDRLIGGAGNDVLMWGTGDRLDGGAGTDALKVKTGPLNLTTVAATAIVNVEAVDLRAGGKNTLTLTAQDVLDMSPNDTLKVLGDAGDRVSAAGFTAQGAASGGFRTYTNGLAKLMVETDVVVA